jgi:hypothetical protein
MSPVERLCTGSTSRFSLAETAPQFIYPSRVRVIKRTVAAPCAAVDGANRPDERVAALPEPG